MHKKAFISSTSSVENPGISTVSDKSSESGAILHSSAQGTWKYFIVFFTRAGIVTLYYVYMRNPISMKSYLLTGWYKMPVSAACEAIMIFLSSAANLENILMF